jgi:hypothetical protein
MMDKRFLAVAVAALGGVIVGIAGTSAWLHAPAAPPSVPCIADGSAVDAKADAIVKQLHAHDRDTYVAPAITPIGELPKPAEAEPSEASTQ